MMVALEAENQELREKMERQQARFAEIVDGRDHSIAQLQQQASDTAVEARRQEAEQCGEDAEQWRRDRAREIAAAVALQTARRERAEREAQQLAGEVQRARGELDRLRRTARELSEELGAAELQLRELSISNAPSIQRSGSTFSDEGSFT
jgi:chromosome segregation ATPase